MLHAKRHPPCPAAFAVAGNGLAPCPDIRTLCEFLAYAEFLAHGGREPLIALDIDNTLLAADQLLGSEQWVDAMLQPLSSLRRTPDLFARRTSQLLDRTYDPIVHTLTHAGRYHLTEAGVPHRLAKLQRMGLPTIAVTSRSPAVAQATIRSLRANGIDFGRSRLGRDLPELRIPGSAYPAIFRDGVLFTRGQDKGVLLHALLSLQFSAPGTVLYVDNKQKEVDRVIAALLPAGFEVTACRFAGLDEEVSQYHRQDQPAARVQLKWWARAGMLLSNLEAAEIVERHDRRDPVPVADANRVIYGTEDPLLPC